MTGIYIIIGICVVAFAWACKVAYDSIKMDMDFGFGFEEEKPMVNRRHQRTVKQRQQSARRTQFKNTYKVEDIFEDIPDDDGNVLLNIPPEICDSAGLNVGDEVIVELVDKGLVIKRK